MLLCLAGTDQERMGRETEEGEGRREEKRRTGVDFARKDILYISIWNSTFIS